MPILTYEGISSVDNKKTAQLESSKRIEELELLVKKTNVLFSIAEAGIQSTDLRSLLTLIAENIARGTSANRVAIITMDFSEQKINYFVRGGPGANFVDLTVSYNELMDGLSGWAIRNKKSALSPKNKPDPRESAAVQQKRRETYVGSIVVTPIQYHNEVLGTITVINDPKDHEFKSQDVILIEAAAGQAAIAIVKTKLHQDLADENTERKQVEALLRASEDKFRQLIKLAPDALVITDEEGNITLTNNLCQKLFGYSEDELLGQPLEMLLPARFHKMHLEYRERYYENPQQRSMGAGETMQFLGITKRGKEFPVEVSLSPLQTEKRTSVMAAIRDITERKVIEAEIVNYTLQLTALNKLSRNIVSTFDMEKIYAFTYQTTKQIMPVDAFAITLVNDKENIAEDVYLIDKGKRYPNERVSLSTPSITTQTIKTKRSLLIKDDADGTSAAIGRTLFGSKDDTRSVLTVPLTSNNNVIGIISAQHYQPNIYGTIHLQLLELLANQVAIAIINARLHKTLQEEAIRDPLTGLFNRRFMEETLEKELTRAKRNKTSFSAAIIDIDHFKRINDRFGHDAGDTVLKMAANLMEEKIRSGDIACRYGGEEFALILPGLMINSAYQRMEQLCHDMRRLPFQYKEHTMIPLTCSIGVAAYPDHGTTGEALLIKADQALYQAKKNGRNQVITAK